MLANVYRRNGVKRNIQPGNNTPNQSVFTEYVINIHNFIEQHFISWGPFYSMDHYIDCTELHYDTCPHTMSPQHQPSEPLKKIGRSLDAMHEILLVNYRHHHPK